MGNQHINPWDNDDLEEEDDAGRDSPIRNSEALLLTEQAIPSLVIVPGTMLVQPFRDDVIQAAKHNWLIHNATRMFGTNSRIFTGEEYLDLHNNPQVYNDDLKAKAVRQWSAFLNDTNREQLLTSDYDLNDKANPLNRCLTLDELEAVE